MKLSHWWNRKHTYWRMHYHTSHLLRSSKPLLVSLRVSSKSDSFSLYTIVLSLPISLIRCLWYSTNRERDPVGVAPPMHPPVALTLIPFSVKLPWRLLTGSVWANKNGAQVENKLKKKWVVLFYHRLQSPHNTWQVLASKCNANCNPNRSVTFVEQLNRSLPGVVYIIHNIYMLTT